MTYRVVKKINGRSYLYEQETYREGGKVRTRSQYLGAVDPAVIKRLKSRGEPLEAALMPPVDTEAKSKTKAASVDSHAVAERLEETEPEIKYTVTVTDKPETEKPAKSAAAFDAETQLPKPLKQVEKFNTTKLSAARDKSRKVSRHDERISARPSLRIKAKVERHNISRAALEAEHRRFNRHMAALGLDTGKLGRVVVGTGRKLQARRQTSGNYVITLPRFKSSKVKGETGQLVRTVFKREYRKALAGTYLDAIKAQDPKYYAGLEQNLSQAFKTQNKAISRYIMNSGWKLSDKVSLTLHFMQSKMLSDWTKVHVSSEKLGLADHQRRDNWRRDAQAMMAEVQQRGWSQTYANYMGELSKVETAALRKLGAYRKASLGERLSGKRRKYAREFRKLNNRRKAIHAACDKISVLAPLFQSSGDKHFDGRSPFMHDGNWVAKKKRWETRQTKRYARA